MSLGRPELLYYTVFENGPCELNRWLEHTGWSKVGQPVDMAKRRSNIKMTMWSGLPVLVSFEESTGLHSCRWKAMTEASPGSVFEAWLAVGPRSRALWLPDDVD